MKRSIIIGIVCMTLSAQALAWTAMSCCDGADAASTSTPLAHHDMDRHAPGGGPAHCGDGADQTEEDQTASYCCAGALCSSVSAVPCVSANLSARVESTELSTLNLVLPNAPAERLLRPPIA